MFYDPTVDFKCLIDRTSGGGKTLRRVFVILNDGAALICKTNGAVCRIFHVSQVTHLIHSPSDSSPAGADPQAVVGGKGGGANESSPQTSHMGDGKDTSQGNKLLQQQQQQNQNRRVPAKHFLIRIQNEHDLLFYIVPSHHGARGGVSDTLGGAVAAESSHGVGARNEGLQLIETLIKHRSALGGLQLHVVERMDSELLKQAANVVRPANYVKPKATSVNGQLFIPILFDDFSILTVPGATAGGGSALSAAATPAAGGAVGAGSIAEGVPLEVVADASFLTLLQRAVLAHPMSSSKQPQVAIDAPAPFKPFQVSEVFFTAFCQAFDEHVPMTVHVRSHLPNITTFRCSDRFWRFITHTLRVTRPPEDVFSLVTTTRIEAHVEGKEQHVLTCTIAEWNDAIIAWENSVRASAGGRVLASSATTAAGTSRHMAGAAGGRSAAAGAAVDASSLGGDEAAASSALFWRSFVAELETGRGSVF